MWYFEKINFPTFGLLLIALFYKFFDTFFPLQKAFFTKLLAFGIYIKGKCLNLYCQTKRLFDIFGG